MLPLQFVFDLFGIFQCWLEKKAASQHHPLAVSLLYRRISGADYEARYASVEREARVEKNKRIPGGRAPRSCIAPAKAISRENQSVSI